MVSSHLGWNSLKNSLLSPYIPLNTSERWSFVSRGSHPAGAARTRMFYRCDGRPKYSKSKFPLPTLAHANISSLPPRGELSLAELDPLASRFKAWAAIPGVSSWVLKTIQRGYSFQFAHMPPCFRGIIHTSVQDNEHVL